MKEKLKFIKGFKDYLISDQGNIYSLKFSRVLKMSTICVGKNNRYVRLRKDDEYVQFNVNRLVAKHFPELTGVRVT